MQERVQAFRVLSSRSSELNERSITLAAISQELAERSRALRKRLRDLQAEFQRISVRHADLVGDAWPAV